MASLLVATGNSASNSADNTALRAAGTLISNAFANAGWTKANDAGQIDWTLVVANGTYNNVFGYEMWSMAGPLQNTSPVTVKIQYYATGTREFGMLFLFGSGTDGALNLTGPAMTSAAAYCRQIALPSTSLPCFFCGSPNRIAMALWSATGNYGITFAIERTHDAQGNDTAEGVILYDNSTNVPMNHVVYWNAKTGVPGAAAESNTLPMFIPSNIWAPTDDGIQYCPIYPSNGAFLPPFLSFVGAYNGIVPNSGLFPQPINLMQYGVSRRFLPLPYQTVPNRSGQTYTSFMPCMLYE